MTLKQFLRSRSEQEVDTLAKAAKTSSANLKQIAFYGSAVGKKLAERIATASDGMITELEVLYPERFEKAA